MTKESSDSLSLATTALTDRLERNPYAVVAAAVGVGYVLGGGLFTRLTARIVGTALRMGITATLPFLKEELLVAVMQDFKGTAPPKGVEAKDPPAKGHARHSKSG
ncbi:MAG: hypothetical protein ABJA82_06545 [Myxococcales bacterium]